MNRRIWLCLTVVTVLLFLGCGARLEAPHRIEPAVIAGAWLFDDGEGDIATDSSGNSNDGDISGARWVDGKFGKALEFDGIDDYVRTGFQAIEPGEGTITAWVKSYTPNASQHIAYTSDGRGDGWGGEQEFHISLVSRYEQESRFGFFSRRHSVDLYVGSYETDRWYHIALTWKAGGQARLYIDSKLLGQEAMIEPDFSGWMDYVYIGRPCARKRFFHGVIDDVLICNVALTEDAIKSIMDKGLEKALGM